MADGNGDGGELIFCFNAAHGAAAHAMNLCMGSSDVLVKLTM